MLARHPQQRGIAAADIQENIVGHTLDRVEDLGVHKLVNDFLSDLPANS
jgi:hypothetical protein